MFIEVSAKTGINIKQLFKDLATSLPGIKTEEEGDQDATTGKIQLQADTKKPDEDGSKPGGTEKKKCCGG